MCPVSVEMQVMEPTNELECSQSPCFILCTFPRLSPENELPIS